MSVVGMGNSQRSVTDFLPEIGNYRFLVKNEIDRSLQACVGGIQLFTLSTVVFVVAPGGCGWNSLLVTACDW